MRVSKHAQGRSKQRIGLPKKSILKNTQKALDEGVKYEETTGRLKKYISYLCSYNQKSNKIRLTNNHVYIFSIDDVLITVLHLPNEHKNAVCKILERKKEDCDYAA